jgi:hypothetical protein
VLAPLQGEAMSSGVPASQLNQRYSLATAIADKAANFNLCVNSELLRQLADGAGASCILFHYRVNALTAAERQAIHQANKANPARRRPLPFQLLDPPVDFATAAMKERACAFHSKAGRQGVVRLLNECIGRSASALAADRESMRASRQMHVAAVSQLQSRQ